MTSKSFPADASKTPSAPSSDSRPTTYEAAMARLEALACEMEAGDVAIDLLASKLKEAQRLLAFCRDKLTRAEEEVQKLLETE